ncbi:hypothetical protein O3M35_012325 [Rhynocoris fuscipes]|uniref:Uncharacterized protein n=1 Tax=Rhynocoris fuscipes TaxID=488301 RepID=A0AAW1CSR7_9HEMI
MFSTNYILRVTIASCLLLCIQADDESESIIAKYEQLQLIRQQYSQSIKIYLDARITEINRLLGSSSSKWDFIGQVNEISKWWTVDINRRLDLILSKLPNAFTASNQQQAFLDLKNEFEKHLKSAESFWTAHVDKSLKQLRENPNIFKGLIREPIFTTESPALKLSADKQPIYLAQISNLTNIAAALKDIFKATVTHLLPELPDRDNITYISRKTRFDMLIDQMTRNEYKLIDSTRIFATERISGSWRTQNGNGPSQQEFDVEYKNLSRYANSFVKQLNQDIQQQLNNIKMSLSSE